MRIKKISQRKKTKIENLKFENSSLTTVDHGHSVESKNSYTHMKVNGKTVVDRGAWQNTDDSCFSRPHFPVERGSNHAS